MVSLLRYLTVCVLVVVFAYAFVDWWNPFGADGVITKIVETLPGGGFITAPFHAAAGNIAHAIQAAIAGFGTLAALAIGGPPGALAAGVTAALAGLSSTVSELDKAGHLKSLKNHNDSWSPAEAAGLVVFYIHEKSDGGIENLFDQLKLSKAKKQEALRGIRTRDYIRAGKAFLEAVEERVVENTRELAPSRWKRESGDRDKRSAGSVGCHQLSAQSGGRRILKSVHGTFLRANESGTNVDMVRGPAKEWENWYIEDWCGKVALKGRGGPNKPGQFLQAHPDGSVDLTVHHPNKVPSALWKPFKNHGGSWSFLSIHGTWLSAREDRSVSTVGNCDAWEHFTLDWWQ